MIDRKVGIAREYEIVEIVIHFPPPQFVFFVLN